MMFFSDPAAVPPDLRPVLALGNFDGVHCGHQAILAETLTLAETLEASGGVLTFSPHPRQILVPDAPPFRLMHPLLQRQRLAEEGMQVLVECPVTSGFLHLSARSFVEQVLVEQLKVRGVVCGADFLFGHQRQGNTKFLEHLGEEYGFAVRVVSPCRAEDGHQYSSSAIRHALRQGQPEKAAAILGMPWTVLGTVIHGQQRGRAFGFPTANIDWQAFPYLHPRMGVYAVEASLDGHHWLPGVANLGQRPTVAGQGILLEVHLLDTRQEIYGLSLQVRFHTFLRDEQHFPSVDVLREQIEQDCNAAKKVLKNVM